MLESMPTAATLFAFDTPDACSVDVITWKMLLGQRGASVER